MFINLFCNVVAPPRSLSFVVQHLKRAEGGGPLGSQGIGSGFVKVESFGGHRPAVEKMYAKNGRALKESI